MFNKILNDEIFKDKLDSKLYEKYLYYKSNYLNFDDELIDNYSRVIKEFAFENNCKYYSLLFLPLDNRLAYKKLSFYKYINNKLIYSLDESDLFNQEVDASSFKSGGYKDITDAKGLVSIDYFSHPFIYLDTLYIPAIYSDNNYLSLDNKRPLLNSLRELNKVLKSIYSYFKEEYNSITPYLGIEQEFYLIEKDKYEKRNDLKFLDHFLFNSDLFNNNNYFKAFNFKEEKMLKEIIEEISKIGIIPKSFHKEGGVCQFEITPLYTVQNQMIEQNECLKGIIKEVSLKHNYISLFDDKPFLNLSGSGKHNNYSIFGDNCNLFDYRSNHYLLLISAFILGIDKYNELIRLSSSSFSNERRLNEKEAPGRVITISLSNELQSYLKEPKTFKNDEIKLKRNRTSPIDFLGNKIEFRMLGSSVDPYLFNICLNTILIVSFKEIYCSLLNNQNEEDIIKDIYSKHHKVIYNENNYSLEFNKEVKKRKLSQLKYYDSIEYLIKYQDIFISNKIFTLDEIKMRVNILKEKYYQDYLKEYQVLKYVINQDILTSLNKELKNISSINKVYLNEYNLDKIEFIKQISNKFNQYSLKIDDLINKVIDSEYIDKKVELLSSSPLLDDIKECYIKIENSLTKYNLSLISLNEILK